MRIDVKVPFIAICAGYSLHSLAIGIDGSLWAWGTGFLGIDSNPTRTTRLTPAQIPNTSQFIQIAAGEEFSMALDKNGHLWYWGASTSGGLGLELCPSIWIPTRTSLENIKMISAGVTFGSTLNSSGEVWEFGSNYPTCTKISGTICGKMISCGYFYTAILDRDMNLWKMESGRLVPINHSLNHIVHITCGGYSVIVYDNEGKVWILGQNNFSELGKDVGAIRELKEATSWYDCFVISGGDHNIVINPDGNAQFFGALDGSHAYETITNIGYKPRLPLSFARVSVKSAAKS
jgi:alpha-tubulin suppressor-like RCC1 family protein